MPLKMLLNFEKFCFNCHQEKRLRDSEAMNVGEKHDR